MKKLTKEQILLLQQDLIEQVCEMKGCWNLLYLRLFKALTGMTCFPLCSKRLHV